MYLKHQLNDVFINETQGLYRPIFFDLAAYGIDEIKFSTTAFSQEEDLTHLIASQEYSFIYVREGKIRTITVIIKGQKLPFEKFLEHFGIEIKSDNIFKTGKYLSRIFRPVRFGGHIEKLDIYESDIKNLAVDGISIISKKLARKLGWNAKHGESGQFTLFYRNGLVKGHCVVSDRIKHDIIVYKGNIKEEIKYNYKGLAYVTVEPVGVSRQLRLDIQTILNLWEAFGEEMFFGWFIDSVNKYVEDLKSGRVTDWLDDFDRYDEKQIDEESWKLKKAILRGVDYRRYPGLVRSAWAMFRNSLIQFAEDGTGNPTFRIPIIGGLRGYIRPDLRNHDENGVFVPAKNKITIDKFGNVWIGGDKDRVERILEILGGADFDDSVGIIPLKDKKALLFRNPNQKGEYIIEDVVFEGIDIKKVYTLKGAIEQKKIHQSKVEKRSSGDNKLIERYLQMFSLEHKIDYTLTNLIRTYHKISQNGSSIGNVANAEMIRSAIGITNKKLMKQLIKKYNWNLENVIDSTVKDGISCKDDLGYVDAFYAEIITSKIPVPKTLVNRIPEKYRKQIIEAENHPVDKLFEAMKYVIEDIDTKIIGKGVVGRDRIKGWIDTIEVPIIELLNFNQNNPMREIGIDLLREYNSDIAKLMDKKSALNDVGEQLNTIQTEFLKKLSKFSNDERKALVHVWATEIYKTERFVHDSILWISGKEGLRGTADDMIEMLADAGLAMHIKKNDNTLERYYEIKQANLQIKSIRLWSQKELTISEFHGIDSVMIVGKQALLGDVELNVGDECEVDDGVYKIKEITHAYSRKNNSRLKNSITVIIINQQ